MKKTDNSHWISIADLMTGLMVMFLFIAINYIVKASQYKYVQDEIRGDLKQEFKKELKEDELELEPDGTVRFNTSGERLLFELGEHTLTSDMQGLLSWFVPRYISTITKPENIKYIKEIRIEGHTDTIPPKSGEDSYQFNLRLSSLRAIEVLKFVKNRKSFGKLPDSTKDQLNFLLTATGMSFSKALNSDGELVQESENKKIDSEISRRVEFRIVTSNQVSVSDLFEMGK